MSLGNIFSGTNDSIIFHYSWPEVDGFEYRLFLQRTLQDFQKLVSNGPDEFLLYNAKDIPAFYIFLFPELSSFRGFFWERTFNSQSPKEQFDLKNINEENRALELDILQRYLNLPSTEIWSNEILNSTINQIGYAAESGFINDKTIGVLLDKMEELIDYLFTVVKKGEKFLPFDPAKGHSKLSVYMNEFMIGDNTVLVKTNTHKVTIMPRNILSSLVSADPTYFEHTWQINENIIRQSLLISESAEKERNKFFNRLRKKVERLRLRLVD